MYEIKYSIKIRLDEAHGWKYCPLCGSDLIEVYPGDNVGHTSCNSDDDDCMVDFEVVSEYI